MKLDACKKRCVVPIVFFSFIFLLSINSCQNKEKDIQILVLGLDGLMPDAIEKAKTPHLHQLINDGTSTMQARAVYPTSSGANWSSMILGCGPDQHGISTNDWTLENRNIIPVVEKDNGFSPSIFDVIKEKYPEERISGVFNWFTIANYFDSSIPDTLINVNTTEEAINRIISELVKEKAKFVFSQIDHMDYAGHSLGFGTEKYNAKVVELEQEIGRLIQALKENNLYENTFIITLSDHGGKGFGHGNKTMAEYTVPFIITGPGIQAGKNTKEAIYCFDVAAIVADILDCEIPNHWTGTPIQSAFGNNNELLNDFTPKAVIYEDSIDTQFSYLSCKVWNSETAMLYQIPEQSSNWHDYKQAIKLPLGQTLKVKVNATDAKISTYKKAFLNHKGNTAKVALLTNPSLKYGGRGAQSINDGFVSSDIAFNNKEWLGFQGEDVVSLIQFDKKEQINSITFRFLENVKSWIFLPKAIRISVSSDGKKFKNIKTQNKPFSMNADEIAIHEFKIDFTELKTKFLKVEIEGFGELPPWHSGAGDLSWLFMDEIIIE